MQREKIESFQGLRGLAILLIMVSHCIFFKNSMGQNSLSHLGGFGVELFIMLSGFLTCYWHLDHSIQVLSMWEAVKYAVCKIRKYYLLHIITLVVSLPFVWKHLLLEGDIRYWGIMVINALLLQDWIPKSSVYFSYNGVAWYLSLMIFFLFASSFILRWLKCFSSQLHVMVLIGIVVFEYVLAGLSDYYIVKKEVAHWLVYIFPMVRILDFVVGGGMYVLIKRTYQQKKNVSDIRMLLILFLISSSALILLGTRYEHEMFSTAVWSIPSAVLIYLLAEKEQILTTVFEMRWLIFLGNISFELFLLHQLIIRYFTTGWHKWIGQDVPSLGYIIPLLVSIVLATWVHKRFQYR